MPVDDVFFEGSRFYAFVPASQLNGHRKFGIQVALVVDSNVGPYSPQEISKAPRVGKDLKKKKTLALK